MKTINICFIDFWHDFDSQNNFIVNTLNSRYKVKVVQPEFADYIFWSSFGIQYLKYAQAKAIKIFFSGENICPDFNLTDYALAFDDINFNDRYMRLPLYCIYEAFGKLDKPKEFNPDELLKRKFCSFVYSNAAHSNPARADFFIELSKYKNIDAGGAMFNNVGGRVPDKLEFVKNYKFNIAFENSCVNGYTTEKIMEPMAVNSLPIYWGNPKVGVDFNPNSFVNAADFKSWNELAKYIAYIDQNDNKYLDILAQPWIVDKRYLNWQKLLLDFLTKIIETPYSEAKILQNFGYTYNYSERFNPKSATNKPSIIKRAWEKLVKN